MAWTTPRTWVPGELVTAGMMNLHVRDNLNMLLRTDIAGVINLNSVAPPTSLTGTVLQIQQANTVAPRVELVSYATLGFFVLRRAEGTASAPTATASGNVIGTYAASGYGTTGWVTASRVRVDLGASQTWTDTAHGTFIAFVTTPNGSVVPAEVMRLHNSGGLSLGNATDPGAGKVNLNGTNAIITATNGTTGDHYIVMSNTGSAFFVGIDNSTGASFGVGTYACILYTGNANGISIAVNNAAGIIRFYSGGSTLRASFTTAGNLLFANGLGPSNASWATTGTAANAVVTDGNVLSRSTSSARWKTDIEDVPMSLAQNVIMGLRAISYRGTSKGDSERRIAGFLAEEVIVLDPMLVTVDGEGLPDYVCYDRVPAYLVPVVQDHERRLRVLEQAA